MSHRTAPRALLGCPREGARAERPGRLRDQHGRLPGRPRAVRQPVPGGRAGRGDRPPAAGRADQPQRLQARAWCAASTSRCCRPARPSTSTCPRGAALDIVVDIRVGSPTYGEHDVVRLDDRDFRAVYLAEGLGHCVVALEDDTVLSYLCSTGVRPRPGEGRSSRSTPALGLPIPAEATPLLSPRTSPPRRWPRRPSWACSRRTRSAAPSTPAAKVLKEPLHIWGQSCQM